MHLATWNVNSLGVRQAQVLDWLALHQPDVLCLQETKLTDERFTPEIFVQLGYQCAFWGQKTYNGVAILSKHPMEQVVKNIPACQATPSWSDEQARLISATVQGVRVMGAYFPNGESPLSAKFDYKMRWLNALHAYLSEEIIKHPKLVLLGDFNIAPHDCDVFDPAAWAGKILCTERERDHFVALLDLGLCDAFRLFEQAPRSWTWWDYRALSFRKNQGLRIDHILVSHALKSRVKSCKIDKAPRALERPSDHAPVSVYFD